MIFDFRRHPRDHELLASQRLFFLRKLMQFRVTNTILFLFYQSVTESVALYNQLFYFISAKEGDMNRLEKIPKQASRLMGREVRSMAGVHERDCIAKLFRIRENEAHPLHEAVVTCVSQRSEGCFLSVKCRTAHFINSFLPAAIRLAKNMYQRPCVPL